MELMEIIEKRRSVRAYKTQEISDEKLSKVLEAARLAPSASNRQPWKFVVVRDPAKRGELAKASRGQSFVGEAPIVIAGVALEPERVMSCGVPAYAVDLAIALEHIALAAQDEGLGTCWIGAFSQEEVKKILGVPDQYKVVALMPIGYPEDAPGPKTRKPLDDIVCYERFSG
ncbi:MAG: nitroreductase [Firmicutes bacterium]|nr:nitroreductase [Bacillota bacterium]